MARLSLYLAMTSFVNVQLLPSRHAFREINSYTVSTVVKILYVLLRRYTTARNVARDNREGSTIEGENNGLLRYADHV